MLFGLMLSFGGVGGWGSQIKINVPIFLKNDSHVLLVDVFLFMEWWNNWKNNDRFHEIFTVSCFMLFRTSTVETVGSIFWEYVFV